MHRGTNSASTTTAAIASSKNDMTVNVASSATKRTASHFARLHHTFAKLASR